MSTRRLCRILTGAVVRAAGPSLRAGPNRPAGQRSEGQAAATTGTARRCRRPSPNLKWAEFPAVAPLVKALNAGVLADDALEVGLLRWASDVCLAFNTSFTGCNPA